MVWKNWDSEESTENTKINSAFKNSAAVETKFLKLANPMDRLAAFIIDMIISLSISSVLTSAFMRSMQQAQLLEQLPDLIFWALLSLLIHLLVYVSYCGLMLARFGYTIGKKVFHIQVKHIWKDQKLSFPQAVLRSAYQLFEIPFVLPLSAVFVDSKRRIWHDRVTDSIVVSSSSRAMGSPSRQEKSFVKGFVTPVYFLFFVLAGGLVSKAISFWHSERDWLADLATNLPHCEAVLDEAQNWPQESGRKADTLIVALGLYSADLISKSCLLSEADIAFRLNKKPEYAYLAKAFVHDDKSELSNRYLLKICDESPDSRSCKFSRLISFWADSDWEKSDRVLQDILPGSETFIRNWAVKHYIARGHFDRASEILDSLIPYTGIANFISEHRTHVLWEMGYQDAAVVSAKSILPNLTVIGQREMRSWICLQMANSSCEKVDVGICSEVIDWEPIASKFSETESLAMLGVGSCEGMSVIEISNKISKDSTTMTRLFLRSLQENRMDRLGLLKAGVNGNMPPVVTSELIHRISKESSDLDTLDQLKNIVLRTNPESVNWDRATLSVIEAYYRANLSDRAQMFSETVWALQKENDAFHKKILLKAYSAKNLNWVRSKIKTRQPASFLQKKNWLDSFRDMKKEIRK
ncbi:MAG: RDD family protein [Bdellovibrionales bacterium]